MPMTNERIVNILALINYILYWTIIGNLNCIVQAASHIFNSQVNLYVFVSVFLPVCNVRLGRTSLPLYFPILLFPYHFLISAIPSPFLNSTFNSPPLSLSLPSLLHFINLFTFPITYPSLQFTKWLRRFKSPVS